MKRLGRSRWRSLSTLAFSWLSCLSMLSEAQAIPGGADQTRPGVRLEKPVHVFLVDDTPLPCTFRSIQRAVDAASDGDVVLVRPGIYAPFSIDGKSLCVIGEGLNGLLPRTGFAVKNLKKDQAVIVRGFSGALPLFGVRVNRHVLGNAGPIWVEDCKWDPSSSPILSFQSTVGFFRTETDAGSSETGADGLFAESSKVFAYHSRFVGRRGGSTSADMTQCFEYQCRWEDPEVWAGAGVHLFGGSAFLFGCSLLGGLGGTVSVPWNCDACGNVSSFRLCGGPGLRLENFMDSVLLDTQIYWGQEACGPTSGWSTYGVGTLTQLRGRTGEFSVDSPVRAGAPIRFRFKGPPGWKAFVTYSSEYTPTFDPRSKGMSVVPLISPTLFVGTIPPSGELIVTRSYGNLVEPGSEARVIFLQAKFYNPDNCTAVLGTPSVLVVYEDCP